MPEEEKNQNAPESGDRAHIRGDKKISVLENMRIMNEKARAEELKEESRLEAVRAERDRAARDAYAKKLAEDRIALMKLKQGVISEDDLPEAPPEEAKVYTFKDKVGNFFYHNKMYIIIFGFITALAVFLIYDYVTKVKPDAAMMIIVRNSEFVTRTEDIQALLEPYCEDFNGDGTVYLSVSYLPALIDGESDGAEVYYSQGDQTRLIAEFQTVETIMVVTSEHVTENFGIGEGVFADMTEIYPDDSSAVKHGYMLKGTDIAEEIKFTAMPEDLYIAFRKPLGGIGFASKQEEFTQNYENALKIWDNYLKGNKVSEDMKHYSDRWKE